MSQEKPLHELKNLNGRKLTRRRVMKAAVAAGMSSSAALAMTPEDVKAADSDQVTIPFDVTGSEKRQVAADMIDWYYRARDATDKIRNAHFQKEGVDLVATRNGGSKDNAHVLVVLDDSEGHADERRGEIPEEKNGVRVEVETDDNGMETTDQCDPSYWSDSSDFPGGQEIEATNLAVEWEPCRRRTLAAIWSSRDGRPPPTYSVTATPASILTTTSTGACTALGPSRRSTATATSLGSRQTVPPALTPGYTRPMTTRTGMRFTARCQKKA
jgi:hypothetical protein